MGLTDSLDKRGNNPSRRGARSMHPGYRFKQFNEVVMPTEIPTHRMIEAFRATILSGGIGAAADALGVSQPSMSRVIADLQKIVGFQLFVKHGRSVKPTDEALALMTKVQQSFLGLEDIARFTEQLRKQRLGRLSICALPAIGHSIMPEAIDFLRRKYPNVVVSLDIASSIEVAGRVRNRRADIGLASHALALGEVEMVAEYTANCVCIAAPGGLPADWSHVDLGYLTGRPFVALTGPLQKRLEVMLDSVGGELDIMAEASLSLSVSELVLRGLGIAVVDPFTGSLHRLRGGAALPLRPSLPYSVQAMALGDTRLSAPARDLLHYLETAAGAVAAACR
jgi:DNA-binding transcriptional LysR family regulator